jgi:hypothetical protein
MWRLFYDKTTGTINHMIKSKTEQTILDDRFEYIDFTDKPTLVNVKVNLETKTLEELPEATQIVFPTTMQSDSVSVL